MDPYILPVLFGFLSVSTTAIGSTPLTFILITRKSRHRAGTRYFTRGIDESGNVANFNETEQIVIIGDSTGSLGGYDQNSIGPRSRVSSQRVRIFSYVQTRGSVPAYWAEVNNLRYIPRLQVRGADSALNAARNHFGEQIKLYGDNYLVNLVNQSGREARVKAAYEHIVKLLVVLPSDEKQASQKSSERFRRVEPMQKVNMLDRLHYIYFDFHHECKNMRWHRALLLLDKLGDGLVDQQYFYSIEGGSTSSDVQNYQRSVVRTNCMDCLDRTNVVQSMLARWTLNRQLVDAGVLANGESISSFTNFEVMFRNGESPKPRVRRSDCLLRASLFPSSLAWADNADVVSRAYSGTGALKTDFTRTGVRTKAGAFADLSNSITRYFRNNFGDGPRQDAYDLFLGAYLPSAATTSSSPFVDRRPTVIRAIPYALCGAIFLLAAASVFPSYFIDGESLSNVIRIFALLWLAVALWTVNFILQHGMLYVNWSRLNVPGFVAEGYNEELNRAAKDRLIGRWIIGRNTSSAARERGMSTSGGGNIRLIHLEEGKKRIE